MVPRNNSVFGSLGDSPERRLEVIVVVAFVACLLAECLLNEGARDSTPRQAMTPSRCDEGILATNNGNTATTGREGIPQHPYPRNMTGFILNEMYVQHAEV